MSLLLVERDDKGVVTVTLNRPHVLNALNFALLGEVKAAFETLGDDDSVGCVVLTGAGRAFCAGIDLSELGSQLEGLVDVKMGAVAALRACDAPVIAAVNGVAVTGGLELALGCDMILASPDARFADTHARVGILPRWGLTQSLPRLVGYGRARELSFSGRFLDAKTAEEWGLVNRVVETSDLLGAAHALAAEIAANDRRAVRELKRIYREGDVSFAQGYEIEVRRAAAFGAALTQGEIDARRAAIQEQNRATSKGPSGRA